MSIEEDLKAIKPNRGNPVDRALAAYREKHGAEEADKWVRAVESNQWGGVTMANLLNKYSGADVDHEQLGKWRRHPKRRKEGGSA